MDEYKNFTGNTRGLNTFVFISIGSAVLGAVVSKRKILGATLGLVAGVTGQYAINEMKRKRRLKEQGVE